MQIIILADGRYNNADGRAKTLHGGDVFETSAWYAQELIKSGLAQAADAIPVEAAPEVPAAEPVSVPLTDVKNIADLRTKTKRKGKGT